MGKLKRGRPSLGALCALHSRAKRSIKADMGLLNASARAAKRLDIFCKACTCTE